ncbi:MAG TPA: dihydrofolate reductase [Burkholderiales bacterium]|nr:dihydrofolate reductase [Burkholderiales bacterium]
MEAGGAAGRRLSLIVAMARNGVIGAAGRIPWHLPSELKLFKELTLGHHLIMGRKTHDSIGRLLPGRTTVIVTRQPGYRVPGALIAHSIEEAIRACGADPEIFVIGGAELYRAAMPAADRIYLTTVDAEPAGDTFMPAIDWGAWRASSVENFPADERHAHAWRFAVYDRKR